MSSCDSLRWPPKVAGLVALALILATGTARAGDHELQVTIGPGYSSVPDLGEGLDGVGGGGEVAYGLAPFWSLAVGAFYGHHFGQTVDEDVFEDTDVTSIWLAPRLNLDVFVVIPYLAIGPELLIARGSLLEDQSELEAGIRAALGFDYRPQREWSLGLEVTYHSFVLDPLSYPVFFTTHFRISYHHDFGAL